MVSSKLVFAAVFSRAALAANNGGGTGTQGGGVNTCLQASVIATGSFGSGQGSLGSADGQASSQTSQNNFIDFCEGKTIQNGLQITTGSCNPIPMGDIPSKQNMVSVVFTNPQNGGSIKAGQDFTMSVQTSNLVAGSFTDPDTTYNGAPQFLQGGQIVGHVHISVQDTGKTLNPTTPLDATQFAFFKGINDAGNGKGLLSANVTGGLPAGNYRACTLTSASNHQPVLMPVAQRGPQDDCIRFTVTGSGGTANAASANGSGGQAAAALAASAVAEGADASSQTTSAAANAASSSATKATAAANNNKGGAKANGAAAATTSSSAAAKATGAGNNGGAKAAANGGGNGAKAAANGGGNVRGKGNAVNVTQREEAPLSRFGRLARFARREFIL